MLKLFKLSLAALLLTFTSFLSEGKNWMAGLPDSTLVCNMTIPGTHDTFTYQLDYEFVTKYWWRTQTADVAKQFEIGIRCFDFRPHYVDRGKDSYLQIYHNRRNCQISFDEAFRSVVGFVTDNPSEFAIVYLNYETGDNDSVQKKAGKEMLARMLLGYLDEYGPESIAFFRPDLTLGEVRHKVLIICRDNYEGFDLPFAAFINNWDDFSGKGYFTTGRKKEDPGDCVLYSQDLYSVYDWDHFHEKSDAFDGCARAFLADETACPWCINNASGFMGHSEKTLNYNEFAYKSNPYVIEYAGRMQGKGERGLGIVMMDFAGETEFGLVKYRVFGDKLVEALIAVNYRF